MFDGVVAVRGGGDLGSGVALRLWRCGFPVVVLETECPIAVRRTVAFSEAVYDTLVYVEEAQGRLVSSIGEVRESLSAGAVPVLVNPSGSFTAELAPAVVVDAIMAKRNTGTTREMAALVVALGPGFSAGEDVHAVVETNRGPDLGRVIWKGYAESNTGRPGAVAGKTANRVLRAPTDGILRGVRGIRSIVAEGEVVADVAGIPVHSAFPGLVRGLARDGLTVKRGAKIGDIDPRIDPRLCDHVSDKALAVAGGVLEAILSTMK